MQIAGSKSAMNLSSLYEIELCVVEPCSDFHIPQHNSIGSFKNICNRTYAIVSELYKNFKLPYVIL